MSIRLNALVVASSQSDRQRQGDPEREERELDVDPGLDQNQDRHPLTEQLGPGAELSQVVHESENHDDRSREEHRENLVPKAQREGDRQQEREKDRETAEVRHRRPLVLQLAVRAVDDPEP